MDSNPFALPPPYSLEAIDPLLYCASVPGSLQDVQLDSSTQQSTISRRIYNAALNDGFFTHHIEVITSHYPTIPWRDIGYRCYRSLRRRLSPVADGVKLRYADTLSKYPAQKPPVWNRLDEAFFSDNGISLPQGAQLCNLLDIKQTPHPGDRKAIQRYMSRLQHVEPLPKYVPLEVRLKCDKWKRNVDRFAEWWLSQSIAVLQKEEGKNITKFCAILLEILAKDQMFEKALDRWLAWTDEARINAALPSQGYANIAVVLVHNYVDEIFVRGHRYPTDEKCYRHAARYFKAYADSLQRLTEVWSSPFQDTDFISSCTNVFPCLDPWARAFYFYGMLQMAFERRWNLDAHYRLFCAYRNSFSLAADGLLALSFVALKHARVEAFQQLYLGTCLLGQMADVSQWNQAWNDALVLITDT